MVQYLGDITSGVKMERVTNSDTLRGLAVWSMKSKRRSRCLYGIDAGLENTHSGNQIGPVTVAHCFADQIRGMQSKSGVL